MARILLDVAAVRVEADVKAGEREAARAGERFGRAFAQSADRAASRSSLAGTLAADVERSSARVVKARDAETAATARVLSADRSLSAERAKGATRTQALVDAEQRLDTALSNLSNAQNGVRAATTEHAKAQQAQQAELGRSERSAGMLSGALQKLKTDTTVDFSKLINGANSSGGAFDGLIGKLNLLRVASAGLGVILKPNIFAELIPVALGAAAALAEVSGALLILLGVLTTAGLAFGAIKIATSGFGDALKNIGDPEKFAKSLEKLTPAARSAAIAVQGLKGQFDELRNSLQEKLFAGLDTEISQTGRVLLTVFKPAMESIARSSNTAIKSILQDFRSVREQTVFKEIGTEGARAFDNLSKAVLPLIQAFLVVASVAAKVFADVTGGAGAAATKFAAFVTQLKESGKLEEIMLRGVAAIKKLGTVAGNVFGIIGSVMKASGADGQGFLDTLVKITGKMNEFFTSFQGQFALTAFFDLLKAVQVIVAELAPLGPAVVATMLSITNALQTVAPYVTPLAAAFGNLVLAIQPLIVLAGTVAAAVLSGITTVFRDLKPIVETLVTAIAGFVTNALPGLKTGFITAWEATKPLLAVLAELAGAVLPPLGTAIGFLATVLGPLAPVILGVVAAMKLWSVGLAVARTAIGAFETAMEVLGVVKWAATHLLHFAAVAASATVSAAATAARWVAAQAAMLASAVAQGAVWLATTVAQFVTAAASAAAQAAITVASWLAAQVVMVANAVAQGAIWLATVVAQFVAAAASAVIQAAIVAAAWVAANLAMIAATGGIILAVAAVIAIGVLIVKNWDSIKAAAGVAWEAIKSAVTTAVGATVAFLQNAWSTVTSAVSAAWNAVTSTISGAVNSISATVSSVINSVVSTLSNAWNTASNAVSNAWNAIVNAVSGAVNSVLNVVRGISGQILGALSSLPNQMASVGTNIVNGIGRGIQAGWSYLTNLVSNLAQSLFNAAKSTLGIGSPSKVFATVGKNTGLGVIQGLDRVTPATVAAARRLALAVADAGQIDLSQLVPAVAASTATPRSGSARARLRASADSGDLAGITREAISIVQNIYNPSITDAIDSSNRELRRFATMGGFTR